MPFRLSGKRRLLRADIVDCADAIVKVGQCPSGYRQSGHLPSGPPSARLANRRFVMTITAFGEGGGESSCPGGLGHEDNRRLGRCRCHDRRNRDSDRIKREAAANVIRGMVCWP
jgi:hypothetical protein